MTTAATPTAPGRNIRTAIAGELFVAAELAKRGWVATLTAKNTPGFDIMAVRPESSDTFVRIDVKTRPGTSQYSWRCGKVSMRGERDFAVFVDLGDEGESPLYWIVPAQIAHTRLINDQTMKTTDVEEFRDRWDLLDS